MSIYKEYDMFVPYCLFTYEKPIINLTPVQSKILDLIKEYTTLANDFLFKKFGIREKVDIFYLRFHEYYLENTCGYILKASDPSYKKLYIDLSLYNNIVLNKPFNEIEPSTKSSIGSIFVNNQKAKILAILMHEIAHLYDALDYTNKIKVPLFFLTKKSYNGTMDHSRKFQYIYKLLREEFVNSII